MKGYVVRKGNQYYAVIYEGLDPITGRERLYAALSADGNHVRSGGLDTKTILEIHQVLRRSLDDAVRRGLIVTNPAQVAHAPRRRPLGSTVARAWNAQQLREFLDHIGDHRFFAALWVSANTGLRRGELAACTGATSVSRSADCR